MFTNETTSFILRCVRKTIWMLLVLWGITLVSFFVIHLAPGTPTDMQTTLNPLAAVSYTHLVLLCIQTQAKVNDAKRMRFEARDLYYKSAEEMEQAFKHIPEALSNTVRIAEDVYKRQVIPLSNSEPCFHAERTPMGTAMSSVNRREITLMPMVSGRRSAIFSITGRASLDMEFPKSSCTIRDNQSKYWMYRGRSIP